MSRRAHGAPATPVRSWTYSVRFAAAELVRGLRAHVGSGIAIVVTATVALTMLGGALLLRTQIQDLKGTWYDKTQVAVYLTAGVTPAQTDAVRSALSADRRVAQVWFEDQEAAYANFSRQFSGDPQMVAAVSADQMPTSFRVRLVDPAAGAAVVADLSGHAGVRQVVDEHAQLAKLFDVLTGFQRAALILAAIIAGAAVVLITTTVRSSIVLRADELGIGSMMGASRAQLAVPFLTEVAALGTLATGLAGALLAVGKHELIDQRLAHSGVLSGVVGYVGWDAVWSAMPWLVVAGAGVPVLAGGLVLARYLRQA